MYRGNRQQLRYVQEQMVAALGTTGSTPWEWFHDVSCPSHIPSMVTRCLRPRPCDTIFSGACNTLHLVLVRWGLVCLFGSPTSDPKKEQTAPAAGCSSWVTFFNCRPRDHIIYIIQVTEHLLHHYRSLHLAAGEKPLSFCHGNVTWCDWNPLVAGDRWTFLILSATILDPCLSEVAQIDDSIKKLTTGAKLHHQVPSRPSPYPRCTMNAHEIYLSGCGMPCSGFCCTWNPVAFDFCYTWKLNKSRNSSWRVQWVQNTKIKTRKYVRWCWIMLEHVGSDIHSGHTFDSHLWVSLPQTLRRAWWCWGGPTIGTKAGHSLGSFLVNIYIYRSIMIHSPLEFGRNNDSNFGISLKNYP